MNLFEEYMKRRNGGARAIDAHRATKRNAADAWVGFQCPHDRVEHDGEAPQGVGAPASLGHVLMVVASHDYDVDQLEGLCTLEHHRYKEHKDQKVISHRDGSYWIETEREYAIVEFEDGGIETGWYRKQGYAKQPAIEKAIEARKGMLSWVEDYVQGNVSYGCFEVRILRPDEYEDQGEDAPIVCDAGPLGGVECDDEECLLDTLNELFDEATHGLTL